MGRNLLVVVWLVLSLAWIGFIVGTRFRIGDGYATGFSSTDLLIVGGPPIVLALLGGGIALALRAMFR
ncbi:MAG: hypothetical protein ABSG76_01665 [Xanthobacteraceae bacterium]|jgi:hypothetical protein